MWMDISFLTDSLDSDGDIDFKADLDRYDLNGDGQITLEDCMFQYGSPEAKLWWKNVMEPYTRSQVTPEAIEEYGDGLVGFYKGKPLIPGDAGPGQGDFDMLVDKIVATKGLSKASAMKIAGKVKMNLYGG